jgi:DNA repair protein RecN (Recombination protein N)
MIETLRIRNLAIAEDVRVDLAPGLNVITGETGAGKSLLVAALKLVLGERADKTLVRSGEKQCDVEAEFRVGERSDIHGLLDETGLPPCEDGRLVVRRVVSSTGAGRVFINDAAATLQALARIGDLLVDLHGPHEHQSLLNASFQLSLLDAFGRTEAERGAYGGLYREMRDAERERDELLRDDAGHILQQIDMLSFQCREIDDASLTPGDDEELDAELTRAANATRIIELAGAARNALTEDDASAFQALAAAQRALGELVAIYGAEAEAWLAEARALAVQTQSLSDAAAAAADRTESDPARLQALENRMAAVHRLKKKYGARVADVLAYRANAGERLAALASRGERLAGMERRLAELRGKREEAGRVLSCVRRRAGDKLAKAVTKELTDLGFPHGAFRVGLESVEPRGDGVDAVDFGFAPNAGEPMRPLKAIASSGEISRVMLAIKTVLAGQDRIPVLVFDEVDANVGGEMGAAIGRKLGRVAENRQVLCITHLPQVAVRGDTHFVAAKSVRDGRTFAVIERVAEGARADEVARMLAGRDAGDLAKKHAREMLKRP